MRKGFLGVTWRDASGEDLLVLSAGEDYGAMPEGLASYLETVQVARDESSAEVGDVNQPRRGLVLPRPARFRAGARPRRPGFVVRRSALQARRRYQGSRLPMNE
jgi:hypothetical protein